MNVKHLPIHVLSFFARKIDFLKKLFCPPTSGFHCNTHTYIHAQHTHGPAIAD